MTGAACASVTWTVRVMCKVNTEPNLAHKGAQQKSEGRKAFRFFPYTYIRYVLRLLAFEIINQFREVLK